MPSNESEMKSPIQPGFGEVLDAAPVAIAFTRGKDMVFESINDRMLAVVNKADKHQVIGRPLREVLPELVTQPIFDILHNVLETGVTYEGTGVEVELLSNGVTHRRFFNITYKRSYADGQVPGIFHMASDVTEQVMARRQAEASELKLRSIFNAAPTAVAVFAGPDLIVEHPNQLMMEILSAAPDLEGQSFRQLLPDLVEEHLHFVQLIDTVRATGQAFEAKKVPVYFKQAARTRYFDVSFIPLFDSQNQVYAVLDVSVEVTSQVMTLESLAEKELALASAYEQLRLSKEAAELGTFDMDPRTNVMHWDDRCRILFGISHTNPVTFEQDFIQGLHIDDRDRIIQSVKRSFNKAQSDGEYDVQYRTIGVEDGVERWVRAKGKVYFNAAEQPIRFIGSVLEITAQMTALQQIEGTVKERTRELAEANENFRLANKELQRSNQQLQEFAHAASHDLKEPVRKIQVFTNLLKTQVSDHLQAKELITFNRIESALQRMRQLIDDLLQFSYVTERPHQMEPVNLHESVQRVLEDLEIQIEEKQASIQLDTLPVVSGFPRQLQQLFQNLLTNALKYSQAGTSPRITITGSIMMQEGLPYHCIAVQDNGIGFEQRYEEQIFKMFSRLHNQAEYSGSGVGLSIVKKVVENHQGMVHVQSTVGVGSTFTICLPVN